MSTGIMRRFGMFLALFPAAGILLAGTPAQASADTACGTKNSDYAGKRYEDYGSRLFMIFGSDDKVRLYSVPNTLENTESYSASAANLKVGNLRSTFRGCETGQSTPGVLADESGHVWGLRN